MINFKLNPYTSFVESHLIPGATQYAVAHRLTGEVLELTAEVYSSLQGMKPGSEISVSEEQVQSLGERTWLKQLIIKEFVIPQGRDPLGYIVDQLAARPIQNPALTYKNENGETILVRLSMAQQVYARKKDELPEVIEERLSPTARAILQLADGSRTLQEIFGAVKPNEGNDLLADSDFTEAIEFLTSQERQLIKFTRQTEDLRDPFRPVNTVPRNLIQSNRPQPSTSSDRSSVVDFHLEGIEDASWEFDQIEATVNHSLRFPDRMLGGLDYGSRFCEATLRPEVVPALRTKQQLEVLEVGGGTGTFAQSFIKQSQENERADLNYHVLDLSPVLMANQRKVLADLLPEQKHFHQDATKFDLRQRFDLILSNEVIADFPVASVQSVPASNGQDSSSWTGEGVAYLRKYDLTTEGTPTNFKINVGAMMFIERCWNHLNPGGTLVLSEYGSATRYPVQAYHLNHEEFSIQFSHLAECATKIGFDCRLLSLREFLALDDEVAVFSGREEHLLCLNHIVKQHGITFPYAIFSQDEFKKRAGGISEEIELRGISFLPLNKGFYFGPRIEEFMVLIMKRPQSSQNQ